MLNLREKLSREESRRYILALRRTHRNSVLWNPTFARKSPHERAAIVRRRSPQVASLHLAAICMQRCVRRHQVCILIVLMTAQNPELARRVPQASRRIAASVARRHAEKKRREATAAAAAGSGVGSSPRMGSSEIGLIARFLEYKVCHPEAGSDGEDGLTYNEFVLIHVQAWIRGMPWKMYRRVMGRPLLQSAAASIQAKWRAVKELVKARGPHSAAGLRAILRLQSAWRGYTNKQIFGYFKEVISFREQGDAKLLLRSINPKEANLIDRATQIHIRFRLGGDQFPPQIYYKVYTHGNVTDVCSFAPRDYTAHYQPPPIVIHNKDRPGRMPRFDDRDGWYRRVENNGWRPVSQKLFAEPVQSERPQEWHHVKLERQQEQHRRRKNRKLQWMQSMYSRGRSEESAGGRPAAASGEVEEIEDDLDNLLLWSNSLDFDSYYQDWLGLATTSEKPVATVGPTWAEESHHSDGQSSF